MASTLTCPTTRRTSTFSPTRPRSTGCRQNTLALTEVKKAAELAQSDLRRVHAEDQVRDAQLRRELDALSSLFSSGHDSLTAELLRLKSELASSQAFAGGAGSAGAPGLDSARLTTLEQTTQSHHARLAELTQGL